MKILLNRSVETVCMQMIASVLLKMICEQSVKICMNAHSPVQQKKRKSRNKRKWYRLQKKWKKMPSLMSNILYSEQNYINIIQILWRSVKLWNVVIKIRGSQIRLKRPATLVQMLKSSSVHIIQSWTWLNRSWRRHTWLQSSERTVFLPVHWRRESILMSFRLYRSLK